MSPLLRSTVFASLLVALGTTRAPADEVSEKQKKVALENLKKVDVSKAAAFETDNLLVFAVLPEKRLKPIAESLQKTVKVGRKALQFDEKEDLWKGKLTVLYLPERQHFAQYVRLVIGQKPEGNWHIGIRGDEPVAISGAELGEKATDSEIGGELAPLVAGAMLQSKTGPTANVPGWVRLGFGQAVAARAEGVNSKRFTTYKSQARVAVLGGGAKPPAPIGDVWGSDRPDGGLLAASLMDYLAFGPGQANFAKFLSGLRPGENGTEPAIAAVIEGAGWKTPADLEAAWKKWVVQGSPVK